MLRKIKLVPILVGVSGAIVLALLNFVSWVLLVFTDKQVQDGLRIDFNNLETISTKGVFAAEVMLAGGAVGLLLVAFNFLILPMGLGLLVRRFSKGSEKLHGATISIGLFFLWSLGALTSIPTEPMSLGSSSGVWIALSLYAVSAVSIYAGAAMSFKRR